MKDTVLVTGAAGYIGSHVVCSLVDAGYKVLGVDNFANSVPQIVAALEVLCGKDFVFHRIDLREAEPVHSLFDKNEIACVLHLAGLKSVSESCDLPLKYYDWNLGATFPLLSAMYQQQVTKFVFSSSATVYGSPEVLPISENHTLSPINPYGATKLIIENIIRDICAADSSWSTVSLRYFNPIGAHSSRMIGELPLDQPSNLMPIILQVAAKERPFFEIFGADYNTADGTGIRDYVHVQDLADAHAAAVNYLMNAGQGFEEINIGTGTGYSVAQIVETFETVNEVSIPRRLSSRRQGDVEICFADVTKARDILKWEAGRSLEDMCKSAWDFYLTTTEGLG